MTLPKDQPQQYDPKVIAEAIEWEKNGHGTMPPADVLAIHRYVASHVRIPSEWVGVADHADDEDF